MRAYLRCLRGERSDHAACLGDEPRESGSVRIRRPGIDAGTLRASRRQIPQPRCLGVAPAGHQCARREDTQAGRWRFALGGFVALTGSMFTVTAVLDHAVGGFDR